MLVRVTTSRANWVTGIAIPALPTGEQDEEGEDIYQPPVFIGMGASEFPGDEDTPASGRIYTEYNFNELHLDNYLRRELAPGDTLIDIGCNIGTVAALGAGLVGSTGRVIGFDVQADWANRVTQLLHGQGMTHAFVHPFGLSDRDAPVYLNEEDQVVAAPSDAIQDTANDTAKLADGIKCLGEIRQGDEVLLAEAMPGRVMLKLDVEGHELHVIRGIPRTLAERVDHLVVEITPDWVGGRAAVQELVETLTEHGFRALEIRRDGGPGRPLSIDDLSETKQAEVSFRK